MKKIGLIIIFLMIIAIFSAGCCGATNTTVDKSGSLASGSGSSSSATDLQLVESHVETGDYGIKYIVGSIKNNGAKTYGYVHVTINLYDKTGAQVGSTLDNVNNLEPGGTWKFKAMWLEEDATSYKIKEITGF